MPWLVLVAHLDVGDCSNYSPKATDKTNDWDDGRISIHKVGKFCFTELLSVILNSAYYVLGLLIPSLIFAVSKEHNKIKRKLTALLNMLTVLSSFFKLVIS